MRVNRVGRSGLQVSEISLGSYLTFGERVSEVDSIQIIQQAFELGINSFDTVNTYQKGEAERIVAKALKPFRRDEYVIGTKAYWPVGDGPNSRGLSRKHLIEQVHSSLKRMDLDYIDIFYCHHFDSETPLEETLRTLDDLIRQGKVLYVGVSNWNAAQLREAIRIADHRLLDRIIVNQSEYSLLRRGIEDEILPVSEELGISQIVFSPLAQGILPGKNREGIQSSSRGSNPNRNRFFDQLLTPDSIHKVAEWEEYALQTGYTISELAVSWVLQQKGIASALVGASSIVQLNEVIDGVSKTIPANVFDQFRKDR